MSEWLSANIGNIIVTALILLAVFLAIRSVIRAKKSGKSCGCGCQNCAMQGKCHEKKEH